VVREIAEEDKPLKNRPGKRGRGKGKSSMKGAMAVILGKSASLLFASVAMLTEHDHWSLEKEEADKLGKALDDALSTLPERAYEKVIAIADKWHPWVQLVFVLGILIWTRIEESAQRVEGSDNQPREGSANGSGTSKQSAATPNYRPYHSSLGYDN
jgi:hypothetical protein